MHFINDTAKNEIWSTGNFLLKFPCRKVVYPLWESLNGSDVCELESDRRRSTGIVTLSTVSSSRYYKTQRFGATSTFRNAVLSIYLEFRTTDKV
jgi:hypothetical protein